MLPYLGGRFASKRTTSPVFPDLLSSLVEVGLHLEIHLFRGRNFSLI